MSFLTSIQGYWKLDESSGNASDSTANANTLVNVNVTYQAGKINNGALFNSALDGLSIADASQTGLDITGDLSISLWVKFTTVPSTAGGTDMYFIDKRKISTNGQYSINYSNEVAGQTNLVLVIKNSSAATSQFRTGDLSGTITTGVWYHLVYVFTAATPAGAIYLNGTSQSITNESTAATSIGNNDGPFTVGYAISPGTVELDGMLDEIGIWSRTLSAAEVTSLYNGGAGLSYPFTVASTSNFFPFLDRR